MATAQQAKNDYAFGRITRAEAVKAIAPYITEVNTKGEELAKEYGVKHRPVSIIGYLR